MVSPVEQKSLLHLLDPLEKFIPADVKEKREKALAFETAKDQERREKQAAYQADLAKAAAAASAPEVAAAEANARPDVEMNIAAASATTTASTDLAQTVPTKMEE